MEQPPLIPSEPGHKVDATAHYHKQDDDRLKHVPGEHLWVCVSMFKVTPVADAKYLLDTENLLTIEGPGCYWCTKQWTPEVAKTKCCGGPDTAG